MSALVKIISATCGSARDVRLSLFKQKRAVRASQIANETSANDGCPYKTDQIETASEAEIK